MTDSFLLDSFVAFATTLSFTHGARQVGVSQPAFFERIRKLEESLGISLYEKQGRALALTSAGERVLAHAKEAGARHATLLTELRGESPRGSVTLAAGEGSYLYLLGSALADFSKNGDTELELLTVGGNRIVEVLRRGEADLAVAALDLVPQSLVAEDLVRTPLCIALPLGHPLSKRKSVRLAQLAGERFVLSPEGQRHRDLVMRALASRGQAPARVLEADGWPLMLAFVRMGLGVAIVNAICRAPGVVLRPLPELGFVTYRLLRRKALRARAEIDRLAQCILAGSSSSAGMLRHS